MKLTRFEKILLLLDFAKELIQKFWQKICGSLILKASACLSITAIVAIIIFSYKPHAQSLPSCSSLGDSDTPVAGVNCLYFGLPLCKTVQDPKHRVNCADIIDLPLCSDIVTGPGISVKPGKNCVDLCSSPAYGSPNPADLNLVRSEDYAIHNRECIRFCDDVEEGVVANPSINCSQRKCHQVPDQVNPVSGANCDILPCNLLTHDELNKQKFDDDTKKYCEGDNLKCYDFIASQLKHIRRRSLNPTCVIHNCTPSSEACGPDDVLNITKKGIDYQNAYEYFVNGQLSVKSQAYCTPISCKPVVKSQYRCTSETADRSLNIHNVGNIDSILGTKADIYRNPNCDDTGDGAFCGTLVVSSDNNPSHDTLNPITNYCFKTTDCNKAENAQAPECLLATNTGDDNGSNVDPFQSWFYRPTPPSEAVDKNTGLLLPMEHDLCYTERQMRDRGWGFNMPFWTPWKTYYEWFHSSWIDPPRSPGACNTNRDVDHGSGYVYLCGTNQLLYNKPSPQSVYFKGYAVADFKESVTKYKVTVCTRFANPLSLKTCGKRSCGVNAWFGDFTSQACGGDVCRELTIEETDPTKCMMNSGNSMSGDCVVQFEDNGLVGGYLRVRAVKYDDKICGFLDVKGQTAYDEMFFDGEESITFSEDDQLHPTTLCVNDSTSTDGNCRGYNSNSTKPSASEWRTILQVGYVNNNRPAGTPAKLQGYIDKTGRLHKKQTCPKITLRIPPPDQYNVATINNSEKLFAPPVAIYSVSKIRNGEDAVVPSGEIYGKTDFHYPEIKVRFGIKVYRMGLGFGYTGGINDLDVENHPSSPSSLTVTTNLGGKDYEARLFVRKEFFENNPIPQFCLYRKIKDQNGIDVEPLNIGCVARNAPEINNAKMITIDPSLPLRKLKIAAKPNNEYNNSEIQITYLDGGVNKIDNGCSSDDKCSAQISLANSNYKIPTCVQNVENHKICVQREECSAIYIECIQNEIDINNARNSNQSLGKFLAIRKECNEVLVPKCNRKNGITTRGGDIYDQVPLGAVPIENAYGWFNELCVVNGFETKLRKVLAYNIVGKITGKCLIDPTSPYLKDNNPATNCDIGGHAPNCICSEAPEGYVSSSNIIIRTETAHEAGLCIDMPVPSFCLAIDYTPIPNSDPADPEYINSSLGKSTYNNLTGVNLTHQNRSNGTISGYAEFERALPKMDDVRGQCKGFWTYATNSAGVTLHPLQSCLNNNGVAAWDQNVRNQCVRFSCPDILTAGPDSEGKYQGGYGENEINEDKGKSNGFALWLKYTKTNDFLETRTAQSCIAGFKPINSVPNFINTNRVINSTFKLITSYSGGTLPSRQCDQLGNWLAPTNSCERISCPAINIDKPKSSAEKDLWAKWYNNGGASFPSVLASRSTVRISAGSVSKGTCNNEIGFYKGGVDPTIECDYLGNWSEVKNPCTTSCDAIDDDAQALSKNNGFSKWQKVNTAISAQGVEGVFDSCARDGTNNYVTNPYPPAYDLYGKPTIAVNDATKGTAEPPRRLCKNGSTSAGIVASVWGPVSNGCINRCPGIDPATGINLDPRIGVGVTVHPFRSAGAAANYTTQVNWPSTELGKYAYVTNWEGLESLFNAAQFAATSSTPKSNRYYLLRRFCNSNGKWSDPEAMCSINNGQIANAKYNKSGDPGYSNSLVAGSNTAVTGTCIDSKYWYSNANQDPAPQKTCLFADSNKYIDRVYLDFANNTKDCEQIKCPPAKNLGTRSIVETTSYKLVGEEVFGRCLSKEPNKDKVIVYTSLDQKLLPPRMQCQSDGKWKFTGDENCKVGCDIPSKGAVKINPDGDGNGEKFTAYAHSLAHNQHSVFTAFACEDGKYCINWTRGATCKDGVAQITDTYYHYRESSGRKVDIYDPMQNKIIGTKPIPTHSNGRIKYTHKSGDEGWGVYFNDNDIQNCTACDLLKKTPHKNKFNVDEYLKVREKD